MNHEPTFGISIILSINYLDRIAEGNMVSGLYL